MREKKRAYIEQKINKQITVILAHGTPMIYFNNKFFRICSYILLINPQENKEFEEIDSIDEAQGVLSSDLDGLQTEDIRGLGISEEEEFWAHCSNLQAWVENGYDTKILHSNLSFPLLKKLAEDGDLQAKKIYRSEILKRFESKYFPTIDYLTVSGFTKIFSEEECKELTQLYYESLDNYIEDLKRDIKNAYGREIREEEIKEVLCRDYDELEHRVNLIHTLKRHLKLRASGRTLEEINESTKQPKRCWAFLFQIRADSYIMFSFLLSFLIFWFCSVLIFSINPLPIAFLHLALLIFYCIGKWWFYKKYRLFILDSEICYHQTILKSTFNYFFHQFDEDLEEYCKKRNKKKPRRGK